MPYLTLAAILEVLAIIFVFAKLPKVTENTSIAKELGAIKYRHLVLGAICIFMYVGGEVTIGSTLIRFLNPEILQGCPKKRRVYFCHFIGED